MDTKAKVEEVRTRVRVLVRDLAPNPRPEVTPSTRLIEDLGYHSLVLIELATMMESTFAIEPITESEAMSILTVGELEGLIVRRVTGQEVV